MNRDRAYEMMIYILKFGAAWILPPGIFVAREANKSAAMLLSMEALSTTTSANVFPVDRVFLPLYSKYIV